MSIRLKFGRVFMVITLLTVISHRQASDADCHAGQVLQEGANTGFHNATRW